MNHQQQNKPVTSEDSYIQAVGGKKKNYMENMFLKNQEADADGTATQAKMR